ncbi:hypothetical protein [Saccharomonospora viridis]|uniref:Uncharacterized protein n=1 Tax=Saccharomonospora viridis TaxID=1852 RepID=A0A837D7M5_9PSEU|nr:hypothetical protein [Saccharomonospora viridis]KHF42601.1 hypothetical protein MINT15_28030 [Saccharomonospora viridis]
MTVERHRDKRRRTPPRGSQQHPHSAHLKTPPTRTGHDEEVNNMADVPRTLGEHTVD